MYKPEEGLDQQVFKGQEYDYILWLDDDIVFTPEDFEKLYKEDKDVISGLYLMANGSQITIHSGDVGTIIKGTAKTRSNGTDTLIDFLKRLNQLNQVLLNFVQKRVALFMPVLGKLAFLKKQFLRIL